MTRKHYHKIMFASFLGIAVVIFTTLGSEAIAESPTGNPTDNPWQTLINQPPFDPGSMVLLTDGTVMVQNLSSNTNGGADWWKLKPDINGSYVNGTWSQIASMPAGYNPLYYASAVLPSGQVIFEGGEYDLNTQAYVWMGRGAIYDPLSDIWTSVAPPPGMDTSYYSIGDAEGIVLANGQFMLSPVYIPPSGPQQILNATNLTWTASGREKADGQNDEESQVLLPNGDVLTVDISDRAGPRNSEIYDPNTGAWTSAGDTKVQLTGSGEMGPLLLRPDGTVFAVGATGHSAIYMTQSRMWMPGPDFPIIDGLQYEESDGPAAVLPNGNVLVMAAGAGPNAFGSHFFEFDGHRLNQVMDSPNAEFLLPHFCRTLVLPTGQVLFNGDGIQLYTPSGSANPSWAPGIITVPTSLSAGSSYTLDGSQLSGLSQGAAYGDDSQSATNYPLVRIVNNATGHVFYALTFNRTSSSVARNVKSSTSFQIPDGIEAGASTLAVVANGISSKGVFVTIMAKSSLVASTSESEGHQKSEQVSGEAIVHP
ncbi:MAG: hypothetical protein JWM91_3237 [Rhodospirillales bacterium]|nr:hypothetical protein [Rhodospirillales bacterium]